MMVQNITMDEYCVIIRKHLDNMFADIASLPNDSNAAIMACFTAMEISFCNDNKAKKELGYPAHILPFVSRLWNNGFKDKP
jgi:hypothetical protein